MERLRTYSGRHFLFGASENIDQLVPATSVVSCSSRLVITMRKKELSHRTGEDCVSDALVACTTCAPNAMHVLVDLTRREEQVDDVLHVWYVDTTSSDVCIIYVSKQ